jgi:hypothetical protein
MASPYFHLREPVLFQSIMADLRRADFLGHAVTCNLTVHDVVIWERYVSKDPIMPFPLTDLKTIPSWWCTGWPRLPECVLFGAPATRNSTASVFLCF